MKHTLINLTGHDISLYSENGQLITTLTFRGHAKVYVDDDVDYSITVWRHTGWWWPGPEDDPKEVVKLSDPIDNPQFEVPVRTHKGCAIVGLSRPFEDYQYIVSSRVVLAAIRIGRSTEDLLIPDRPIYDSDGHQIGVKGFVRMAP
jgi:hypothetical protein